MKPITATLLASLFVYPACIAASEIEEVKVVADFRGGDAIDLATSLSVIDADTIEASSARHFDELIESLPNLNFSGGTSRARFFQIRGIGERSQFAAPLNPSVGFIVDNVDFSGVGSIGTLLDVSQIEVFRGPQGTRYGANGLAGLIYIKTNDPTDSQTFSAQLSAAEYGHQTLSMVYNQPLTTGVSARLALETHESDGFYENVFLGSDNNNQRDELTARLKLGFDDIANWALDATLTKIDVENGYDIFSLDNNRRTRSDQPGQDSQDSNSLSLEASREFSWGETQVIAALANSDLTYSYDEDWTFTGFDPIGYTSFDEYVREKSIRSFETRFLSGPDQRIFNDSTEWIVGFYHLDQTEDLTRNYTFIAAPFASDYDFQSSALFAQLESQFSDHLSLAWGARYEQRDTEYNNSDLVEFSPDESFWGGEVSLKYALAQGGLAYLSLARGYKAGGFNTDGTLPISLREFDSETLLEWEVGIKTRLLDDRIILNTAIFYDQRRDQQVKSSFVQSRPDGSTEFVDFLGNAAEGTNRGLEVSVNWQATDHFNVDVSLGLLSAEFDDFINEFGEDLSGRDQAQAPSHSYQVSFNWDQGPWSATTSWQGKDEFFFSDRHQLKSTGTNTLNARLQYQAKRIGIAVWGRNLSDKDYTTRGFGSFGNDPRNGYTTEPYVAFGDPRVVGVTVDFQLVEH